MATECMYICTGLHKLRAQFTLHTIRVKLRSWLRWDEYCIHLIGKMDVFL